MSLDRSNAKASTWRPAGLGGLAFAIVSAVLALTIGDETTVQAVISGLAGGVAFAVAWVLFVRWRQRS